MYRIASLATLTMTVMALYQLQSADKVLLYYTASMALILFADYVKEE